MNAALPTVIYDLIYIFSFFSSSTPCIHLIYSLSFQSIFNDFDVPVCLLLLIVVVFYLFVYCLSCLNINRVYKKIIILFLIILSPFFTYSVV